MRALVATVVVLCAASAFADPLGGLTGHVADPIGDSVEGATVIISGSNGIVDKLVTSKRGRFAANLAPGDYTIIFIHGSSRSATKVHVTANKMTIVDGEVDPNTGEVIYVNDKAPPPVAPRAPKKMPRPRYSDEAIERDVWTRAWMLLDVDENGRVLRAKFLHRPGADLDAIALETVFSMTFDPARDAAGNRIRARTVWGIEWPSFWWIVKGAKWTRCRGTGPLNLDSVHPVYRDCTEPKLENANREAWIPRPI
jgi:hypothetical protein